MDHVVPVLILDTAKNDGQARGPILFGGDVVVLGNGQKRRLGKRAAAEFIYQLRLYIRVRTVRVRLADFESTFENVGNRRLVADMFSDR